MLTQNTRSSRRIHTIRHPLVPFPSRRKQTAQHADYPADVFSAPTPGGWGAAINQPPASEEMKLLAGIPVRDQHMGEERKERGVAESSSLNVIQKPLASSQSGWRRGGGCRATGFPSSVRRDTVCSRQSVCSFLFTLAAGRRAAVWGFFTSQFVQDSLEIFDALLARVLGGRCSCQWVFYPGWRQPAAS